MRHDKHWLAAPVTMEFPHQTRDQVHLSGAKNACLMENGCHRFHFHNQSNHIQDFLRSRFRSTI